MSKPVSMQTIADRLGVSKYTVSQALSGKSGIGRNTRQQVLEMAEMLGYRVASSRYPGIPAAQSQPLSSTSSSPARPIVALHMRSEIREEPTFWRRVLGGVQTACAAEGWDCVFVGAGDPASAPEVVPPSLPTGTAGIIAIGTIARNPLLALYGVGLPLILIDHEEPLLQADAVLNDNQEAARTAVRHLLQQGCRTLTFVGRDRFSVSFKERWWGCKQVVEEWKKTHPNDGCALTKWTVSYPDDSVRLQLSRKLTESLPEQIPDGFICANDGIAMSLLLALKEAGITVPNRCRVVGIDNVASAAASEPPLTTVDLAKEQLGARAVHALKRRMERGHDVREKIILAAGLVVRSSG